MLIRKLLLTVVLGIASTQGWASCSMKCTKTIAAGIDITKLKSLAEDVKKCISSCPLKDTKNFTCVLLSRKFEHPNNITALLEMLHQGPGEDLAYGIERAKTKLEAIALSYKDGDVREFQAECGMNLNQTARGKQWIEGGTRQNFDENLDMIRVKVAELYDGEQSSKAPSFEWTSQNATDAQEITPLKPRYNQMRFKISDIRTARRK
ncbi:MAG: hypothetical protein K2Q34_03125 [Alphaproteobacteria bacterium]|nr:hypothetical protein [Alphaproteobacteria bacterium]